MRCDCLRRSIRQIKLATIPPLYRMASIATAVADPNRHKVQPTLFEMLRGRPDASYVLCGSNGSGKTMAGWMLYRWAVEHDKPAVGLTCAELVAQYRAWQFDAEKVPVIEPGDLKTGEKRLLFLDELDKARPTEFAAETLFHLFDAAYSYQHQIVVTSNTPLEGLAEHWSRNAITIGPSIVRRLMEIHNGILVDMF